jgi:hypothetical protein
MTTRKASLRILVRVDWMTEAETVTRLWDGAGPYVDADGNVWIGASAFNGLDAVEQAINGEASTLNLALAGVSGDQADLVWLSYTNDEIIGSTVRILIQPCDANDQPVGAAETRFTGTIDNILFDDTVVGDRPTSSITVECTNRFTLRRLTNGAVLSDADQRARAAVLNPLGTADRFCERVPLMQDKTIVWPRWN